MMQSVYPSGAAIAQASVPITPPAPPRLSTNTCWPSWLLSCCATSRPTTSLLPPGGNGTIKRTGRFGESSAKAFGVNVNAREARGSIRDSIVGIVFPGCRRCSVPIGREIGVLLLRTETAQHGGPFQDTVRPSCARLIHVRRVRQDVLSGHCELGACGHRVDLRAARQFELIHGVESLLNGGNAGQQAVIAHDQGLVRPEVANQALTLVELDRRTFVVVIADVSDKADRGLRQRQQPAFHGGDRHAGAR